MDQNKAIQTLNVVASFVIIVAGLKAASSIIVPFLLAIFIAILASPPLFFLRRKNFPIWMALTVIILSILGITVILVLLLGASLDDFARELPRYQTQLVNMLSGFVEWAQRLGVDLSVDRLRGVLDPAGAFGIANSILGGLTNLLSNGFLILLTIAFILAEATSFPDKVARITGDRGATARNQILINVRRYIGVKSVISAGTGVTIGLLTWSMGLDFPLLWAIFGFLLNFVPTIGSIIAAIPACLVALVQLGIWPTLFTALGYFAINVTFGNLIEPRVMGRTMGLSTLVVFLSLVFWGWVLGPVGMLLSVPLTMVAKIAFEQNENTRTIAILLGPGVESGTVPGNSSATMEGPGNQT